MKGEEYTSIDFIIQMLRGSSFDIREILNNGSLEIPLMHARLFAELLPDFIADRYIFLLQVKVGRRFTEDEKEKIRQTIVEGENECIDLPAVSLARRQRIMEKVREQMKSSFYEDTLTLILSKWLG